MCHEGELLSLNCQIACSELVLTSGGLPDIHKALIKHTNCKQWLSHNFPAVSQHIHLHAPYRHTFQPLLAYTISNSLLQATIQLLGQNTTFLGTRQTIYCRFDSFNKIPISLHVVSLHWETN